MSLRNVVVIAVFALCYYSRYSHIIKTNIVTLMIPQKLNMELPYDLAIPLLVKLVFLCKLPPAT